MEKIRPGATIRVYEKVKEGEKTRTSMFEGIVIARKHGSEAGATFTVRRVSQGVGMEKVFPIHSPFIDKVEIVRTSKVRRAKLYYLRRESEKETRRKLKKELIEAEAVESQESASAKVSADKPAKEAKEETKE